MSGAKERYEDRMREQNESSNPQNTPAGVTAEVKNTIDKEDLDKMHSLQKRYSEIMVDFGTLKVEKIITQRTWAELLSKEKELENTYISLQNEEAELAKAFGAKYGQGKLNMDTGEFEKE